MPKLSIIIPVYNSAPYLRRCLDSVLAQDFSDWELIIVDDGSNDGGREIMSEYARRDGRITTIFHDRNKGAGAARNSGLRAAKGEFIAFVDSDDWLEKNMYSSLLARQAETGADMVECAVSNHGTRSLPRQEFNHVPANINCSIHTDAYLLAVYRRQASPYVFNKIYRSSIIKNNNIEFIKGNIFEDLFFLFILSFYLKSFSTIINPGYNFYYRGGSTSHQKIINPGLEIITALNTYLVEQEQRNKKPSPALLLIGITILIKSSLVNSFIQEAGPIKAGFMTARQIAKTSFIKNNLKTLLFYSPVLLKDRFFIWLLYCRSYYLSSLFFYLYARYKRGSFKNLYIKTEETLDDKYRLQRNMPC